MKYGVVGSKETKIFAKMGVLGDNFKNLDKSK